MKKTNFKAIQELGTHAARILVVDDDRALRTAVARMLETAGYRPQVAGSAEEADQWLSDGAFELCLLDIGLPRMSGVEFLDWARAKHPELAVIMLTGMDDPDLALECIDAGARTFLIKPVEPAFLVRAVRDALVVRRLLVEHNARTAGMDEGGDSWPTSS